MDKASPILTTHALAVGYRQPTRRMLLEDLNLELHPGSLVCLLGPNGTGKTTLMRTLAGMLRPLAGQVYVQQNEVHRLKASQLAQKISVVLTDRVDTGNMDGYSVVAMGRYPYTNLMGNLSQQDQHIIRWAIETTETQHLTDRPLHRLSDGERQKIMIARALAQDTPLILLDEPTVHLDLPNRIGIVSLLLKLVRETGKTALMSTHDLDLALQTADQLWLLQGKTLLTGIPEDMVLQGKLAAIFQKEGTFFDLSSGTFRLQVPSRHTVRLQGSGHARYWTQRSLERAGYQVVADDASSPLITVQQEHGQPAWRLNSRGATVYYTLGDLMEGLTGESYL